jgi:asparagine synthase (glutamine-hydrolysing)
MYFVSQRARQDVKVALNGQGPDELFGGYRRHLGVRYGQYWASLPAWCRDGVGAALTSLPRSETLKRGLYSLATQDRLHRYQNVLSIAPGSLINGLFHDDVLPRNAGDGIVEAWADLVPLMEHTDELGGMQFLELRSTLPDELLLYADKLSMAHSLEVRVPYLDREVVEFGERLSARFKVRRGVRKWIHRSVCREFLPTQMLHRKKRGFASNVVDDWFRQTMSGNFEAVLNNTDSAIFTLLKPKAVQQVLKSHQSGDEDHHKLLFSFLVCELVLRQNGTVATPAAVN